MKRAIKILFIAGFGPIVREPADSRKLYSEILGIRFKEESGEYLHTEALKGAKNFALWPLSQAAQSCFGKDSWPDDILIPHAWLEFDVDSVEKTTAQEVILEPFGASSRSRNGLREHKPRTQRPYSCGVGGRTVWHIGRHRNAPKQEQCFD